jgi:hypothetical protein
MDNDFYMSNTWRAINEYYAARYEEILENTATANLNRMKAVQDQLLEQRAKNYTDLKSFIDPTTARI